MLLKSYLRDSETQLRIGGKPDPLGVEWEETIAAPPAAVFRALVEPEEVKKWNPYCREISIHPTLEGRYSFGWPSEVEGTDGPDRIVEFQENERITYTWYGQEPKTQVSWSVGPMEGGNTRLRFTHSGFQSNPKMVTEYRLGWAHFLYAVKMLLETGQSMDDWNGRLNLS